MLTFLFVIGIIGILVWLKVEHEEAKIKHGPSPLEELRRLEEHEHRMKTDTVYRMRHERLLESNAGYRRNFEEYQKRKR